MLEAVRLFAMWRYPHSKLVYPRQMNHLGAGLGKGPSEKRSAVDLDTVRSRGQAAFQIFQISPANVSSKKEGRPQL
jgi:hypothetical protein